MARMREARFREAAFAGLQLGIILYPPSVLQDRGFKLTFFNTADVKIGELGTDVKDVRVSDVTLELNDFGCGSFSFVVDEIPTFNIGYRTRVAIAPYFDSLPWFMGFIQRRPDPGARKPFEFSGFGYFDQLDWVTVTRSYSNQDIALIVKDIIETIVSPKTAVIFNAAKVETTGYVTSGTIDFDHVFAKDAIQSLADIAQNFEFGVDNQREFYFRAIDTTVKTSVWQGKHFQAAEIAVDPQGIRNKLYIKSGQISGGSNIIGSVDDPASIAEHGLREDLITAPDLLNSTDATRWANYILGQKKDPVIQAKVINYFLDREKAKIAALGRIRLTTEDGAEYTLPVKRVTYKMNAAGIMADIELGRVIVPFEQHLLDILRRIQEESRLADKRTAQLSE
jgi:hypothetical protein